MAQIESELQQLKEEIVSMWKLISGQMKSAMRTLATMDKESAARILETEKRVNAMEIEIDERCENVFALYNPVAIDLRLVLAMLKINSSLERIGDVAASVARFVKKSHTSLYEMLLDKTHAFTMFEEACDLLDDVLVAFETENTGLAESIYMRDRALNDLNKAARTEIIRYIKENPQSVEECLNILAVIRKLERAGDQSKSIAHEIIFYVEAKVSKHRKPDSA
jgi:phosphate transport system protein